MVNPINASPVTLSVDPISTDLPAPISHSVISVSLSEKSANTSLSTTGASQKPHSSASVTPLDRTLEQLNTSMQAWSTSMRFSIDEDAQRVIVSIVDTETGKILRTVPTDAVIQVAKMIVKLQGGTVNTTA